MANKLPTDQVLSLLAESPRRIVTLTEALAPRQLHTPPSAEGWSINDILAHVRSCADVWGQCIATILAEDHPTIRAINPRTWIKRTNYLDLPYETSLPAFLKQREELLAVLSALPAESWARAATVTGAGNVLERTVHGYAEWLATHERSHVKQIDRSVKAMTAASAAGWRDLLG